MQRQRRAILGVGMPGSGKSTFFKKMIDAGGQKNVVVYMEHINIDDPAFSDYALVDCRKYRGGRAKFSSMNFEGKDFKQRYLSFLKWTRNNFSNGTIIINDCTLYEKNMMTDEMEYVLTMRRHLDFDVIPLFHQCGRFPITMLGLVNSLVLFHTTDNFERKGDSLAKIDLLLSAQKRIEKRWFCYPDGHPEKYKPEIIKLS